MQCDFITEGNICLRYTAISKNTEPPEGKAGGTSVKPEVSIC